MTRMLGSRRHPALARGGGRRRHVRDPRRGDPADLRRDRARDDACATSSPATSRAPATWPRATPAPRAGSGSRSPPPAPGATNLVTAIADAWMDSTPIVCITGQVRSNLIGTDAFQETDATGITMPIVKHSWLVQDARELPQAIKNAFHVARTGRPGPVLVDVAKDAQEAELDFSYPTEVDLPGWRPPTKVHERQVHEAAKAIVEARQPIIYAGGGVINAEASAELLALVEAARLPAVVTLMGKGCLPDSHPLNYGAPGMHGSKYANWALNKSDLIIAVGVALRRPRHRQGLGVRAGRQGDPLRHRRRRGREDPRRRHPRRRPAQARALAADARRQGARGREAHRPHRLARAARGVAGALPVQVPPRRRGAEAADGDRAAARPDRPSATASSSGRPASASTRCGRCSTSSARSRGRSSPRAGSGRWATACRPRSARRRPGPTRP